MLVRMLRLLVQMLVEVRKPSRSILLANVNHAIPIVITFLVVFPAQVNVMTGRTAVNKMRNLHALFKAVDIYAWF